MLRRLLVYQLVLKCISVNIEMSIGLSNSFIRYISVNVATFISFSISFNV